MQVYCVNVSSLPELGRRGGGEIVELLIIKLLLNYELAGIRGERA